jgi:SAM-dependent methyltransferase
MGSAAIEGELWGTRADDWVALAEPVSFPAWKAVFSELGVGGGTRLLDIGCGAGGALVEARRLGAEVSGLDASASLAAIARERNPGARIEVGEMEALPFEDQAFDVVTGFNSFQFAADTLRALREARRVCRSDGKVAVTIWGTPEECDSVRTTFKAIMSLLPPPPTPAGPSISEPGILDSLLREAGLLPVKRGDVEIPFNYPDPETTCRAMMSAGIVVRAGRIVGDEFVSKTILESLGPFTRPDGSVCQQNRFRWVIATPAE